MKSLCMSLLLLLCGAGFAHAQSVVLSSQDSGRSLNNQVFLLEDPSHQLRIEDIIQAPQQQAFTEARGRASVGQSNSAWWVKIPLRKSSQAPSQWWLEVGAVTPRDIRFYWQDGQGRWQERLSGEQVSFAEGRDTPYRRIVLALPTLNNQHEQVVYLRSVDPAGNSFPLKVWQKDDLQLFSSHENLLLGLLYGCIVAMLLYNLFILGSLRDPVYFWYILSTASSLLLILSMSGHGGQYLWPDAPVPVWLDRIWIPAIWGFSACCFTQSLMQTRRHTPITHYLLMLTSIFYLIAGLCESLDLRPISAKLFIVLTVVGIPLSLYAALSRWRQGYAPALFYLAGYGLILAGSAVLMLRATGVLQPTLLNGLVYPLAICIESIIFSLALAHRVQLLKQEKEAALFRAEQEKNARLQLSHQNALVLQKAVDERTAELAAANYLLKTREQELQTAALHDPLTDLPNRRYLTERARTMLADASRRKESVALLLIDLDHFKPINDTYGHDAGDLMLKQIALRMREQLRTSDMVARLGGDEFAILISGSDTLRHTHEIAQRLLDSLTQSVQYGQQALCISVSIGAALYPQHGAQLAQLYKAADEALYQAKEAGRNTFKLHDGPVPQLELEMTLDVFKAPKSLI